VNIRPDEVNAIAIDRFSSASGLFVSILTTRFERGYNVFHIVTFAAASSRVLKVLRIGRSVTGAKRIWEDWKQKFGVQPSDSVYETDAPRDLSEILWSPPILIKEDLLLINLKMRPVGLNIFVRDITPVDEVTRRAEQVGIKAVVSEENKPRPTTGIVISWGESLKLAEGDFDVGDIVMFSRHAGGEFTENGYTYRYIQLHNIIGWRKASDGIDDILPPHLPQEMIDWANALLPTLVRIAESKPIEPVTSEFLREAGGLLPDRPEGVTCTDEPWVD
jgi:co-chaperonin GroES (HSP10)